MAKMTKKQRSAAAKKAARTRAKNAGRKASKRGKKSKKTSRGLRVGALPFVPHLYGKGLPAALKALGIKAGKVPVVSFPSQPKGGFYAVDVSGSPTARKKKHKKIIAKQARLHNQLGKVLSLLAKAAAAGKDTTALHTRLLAIRQAIIADTAREAKIEAQMRGMTRAQAKAFINKEAKDAADAIGASKKEAAAASAPAVSSAGLGFSGMGAVAEAAEAERAAQYMATNPDVFFQHGKRRVLLDLHPVARGTKGAVSVVVGPQAYKYATLTPKLKSNGFHAARKNMSKKKRSMKRNPLGSDLAQLGKPVLGAGAGFVASRLLNALALYGASKAAGPGSTLGDFFAKPGGQALVRVGATGLGVVATLMFGNKVALVSNNRTAIITGMVLNALEGSARQLMPASIATGSEYVRDLALGGHGYSDYSHAGAPYSPMMGEYVAMNGMGEYVAQSLNGYVAEAAAGTGEYVEQSLNGYADPSDQESIDGMINNAEAIAGLEIMQASAGLGTNVMAATGGFGNDGNPVVAVPRQRGHLRQVSTMSAPMPVVDMGAGRPGATEINENVSTPEGRGYAGGIFGRHVFGTMVG